MPRPRIATNESFAFRYPVLVKMWASDLNGALSPWDVLPGANDVVAWRCGEGHVERRRVADQVINKVKCRTCTYIGTTHPDIAAEVDTRFHGEGPRIERPPNSTKKLNWRCRRCGHSWIDRISDRCSEGDPGCLRCAWGVWQLGLLVETSRRRAGINTSELASCVGLERDQLMRLLAGRELPSRLEVARIAAVLAIEAAEWSSLYEQAMAGPPESESMSFGLLRDGAFDLSRKSHKAQRRELVRVLDGNNVAVRNPPLVAEWHAELNPLPPSLVAPSARFVAFWRCLEEGCGCHWPAWVANRSRKRKAAGCPDCAERQRPTTRRANLLKAGNCLLDVAPDIAAELHPGKNGGMLPSEVPAGAADMVLWTCRVCDHEWSTKVCRRTEGQGCPACWGKRRIEIIHERVALLVASGRNLAKVCPDIADEFDLELNAPLTPVAIAPRSSSKYWWRGSCGHLWDASVAHRTDPENPRGCPYCAHRRAHPDYNLATERPYLASEWDSAKNDGPPSNYLPQSNYPAWWLCVSCGRSWQAPIQERYLGGDCRYCTIAHRSYTEIRLAFELAAFVPEIDPALSARVNVEGGYRKVDIHLPGALNIVIEYDGHRYHTDPEKDFRRGELLEGAGCRVLTLREKPLLPLGKHSLVVDGKMAYAKPHRLAARVLRYLNEHFDVPVEGLAEYLAGDRPVARMEADQFIAEKKQYYESRQT
jgi:transcriptional regulator with XRE-family HTH domain